MHKPQDRLQLQSHVFCEGSPLTDAQCIFGSTFFLCLQGVAPRGDQQPGSGAGQGAGELHQLLADLRRGLSDVHHLRAGLLGSQTRRLPPESKPSAVPEADSLPADQGGAQGSQQPQASLMQQAAPAASGKLGLQAVLHDQIAAVHSGLGSKEDAAKAGRQGLRARPTGMAKRAAAAMAAAAAGTGMELGVGHTGQRVAAQGHRWEGMTCRQNGLPLQMPSRRWLGSSLPSVLVMCLAAALSVTFEAQPLLCGMIRALPLSQHHEPDFEC